MALVMVDHQVKSFLLLQVKNHVF